ncbi:MAG TPA: hypothetical protein DCM02_05550 [Flavobacterium sp.]|nr:hypothetical protein [Flavobacterium sp.]
MITLTKTEQFITFCLECYRQKYNLEGYKVLELFEKNEVFDFLEQSYEVLHTQGKRYILYEIEQFINSKIIV